MLVKNVFCLVLSSVFLKHNGVGAAQSIQILSWNTVWEQVGLCHITTSINITTAIVLAEQLGSSCAVLRLTLRPQD